MDDKHSDSVIDTATMKVFFIVSLVALATGQQFQQFRNTSPAVLLARPGYFQQGGSNNFGSFDNNNQFQTNSFQNNNFRSGSFSEDRNRNQFQQRDSFQGNNKFQNNQDNNLQLRSDNRNQFQSSFSDSFQGSNQNRFNSASFQLNENRLQPSSIGIDQSRFQSSSLQQGQNRPQSGSFQSDQNSFQSGSFQQNQNRFQTGSSQRDQNRFQSGSSQQNQNRFQFGSFQQNQNRFQSNSFLENNQNRFQSNSNRQNSLKSLNTFQSFTDTQSRNSQQFQIGSPNSNFQSNNFQQRDKNFKQQGQFQFRSESNNNFAEGTFEPLNLPSGASYVLGDISTSFSCSNRPYGYYADHANSCRVFHVCNPSLFSDGEVQTYQYSFMCGEGTVFDQKELTCVKESEATPCLEASNFYSKNEEFGRPEEKL